MTENAPAAVLTAVNPPALTTAFTRPVSSSITNVLAGNPLVSFGFVGTETTFIVVPSEAIREGMKSAWCEDMAIVVRWGVSILFSDGSEESEDEESVWKTWAMRDCKSEMGKLEVICSTSELERMRSDIGMD